MPPTVVLIRHAQALHNQTRDHSIPDPVLTDLGIEQCAQLRQNLIQRFSSFKGSIAIIASPMIRTLQTASLAAGWLVEERGVKIEADADWQEISDKPCDVGTPIPNLVLVQDNHTSHQFGSASYDFSAIHPLWPDKTASPAARDLFGHTRSAVLRRGRRCLEKLRDRPEDLVLVFSHAAFLRNGVSGWWYFNADYRVFTFGEGGELVMDEGTMEGGMGWSWAKRIELGSELPEEGEEGEKEEEEEEEAEMRERN
ncbi:phosphoglycerate mutase-like protein [Trichoderma novae-zelandiae]